MTTAEPNADEPYDAVTAAPEFSARSLNGRSLTAAAQILNGPKINRTNRPKNFKGLAWQADAWGYYDTVGEFSWAVEILATAVSKVGLVSALDVPGSDEPEIRDGEPEQVDNRTVQPPEIEQFGAELVERFAGGSTGQQQLLYRVAVQLTVAGESYIVGRVSGEEDVWEAYSNEEIQWGQGKWKVNDGVDNFELTPNDILIRVWRPHPRRRQQPRSSTLPLLPALQEIKSLTQSIAAQVDSRLAGAGLLILPESMSLLSTQTRELAEGEDRFVAELMDAMVTPISNRDSASAVVPIVIKVPDESIGKAQYLRFDAPSDVKDADKREKAIVRMARGMDLPPEQVLGLGESNHWSAWQVDESTVKGPISSLAAIVAHALTIGWYRPALEEAEFDPELVANYLVWFDPTALIQRPDRSEQALQVFDRQGMSLAALLRESGFDESDLPEERDLCRQLLFKMLQADPANAAQWFGAFGACAGFDIPAPEITPANVVRGEIEQGQEAEETTGRELPSEAAVTASVGCPDTTDCLLVACELAVLRTLEIAGKRMRGSGPRNLRNGLLQAPQHELHMLVPAGSYSATMDDLVEGAWSPFEIAVPGKPDLVKDLDDYVRLLIRRREPHDRQWLAPIVARHA